MTRAACRLQPDSIVACDLLVLLTLTQRAEVLRQVHEFVDG